MNRKIFASFGIVWVLGLVACGANSEQTNIAESPSVAASPSASIVTPTTSVSAEPEASPESEEVTPEVTESPVAEPVRTVAAPGTNCGLVTDNGNQSRAFVFGGDVTCDEALTVLREFQSQMTDHVNAQAGGSATLGDFTCIEESRSSRETGAYVTCTNPLTSAYIQQRSGIDPIPGYVADSTKYYASGNQHTYQYGFAPAGASQGTFGCGINLGGLGVVCEITQANGAVSGSPVGGYIKTWKVTMNPNAGVLIEEGGLQGPSETTSQSTALDIGTVINFNGVSCQALSSESVRCIGQNGAGFTISPQGVSQP